MTDVKLVSGTTELICKDFGLVQIPPEQDYEKVKAWLSYVVEQMMEQDFEKFIFVLYRLDIPERKVMVALSNETKIPANEYIADLIIEREVQKIKSRQWYKKHKTEHARDESLFMEQHKQEEEKYDDIERW